MPGSENDPVQLDPFQEITEVNWDLRALLVIDYIWSGADSRDLDTVTTVDRFGLVTIHGTQYRIVDIRMRMLTPRELFRAQGFPDSIEIDRGATGERLSKKAQVRLAGNSVEHYVAKALFAANLAPARARTRTTRAA